MGHITMTSSVTMMVMMVVMMMLSMMMMMRAMMTVGCFFAGRYVLTRRVARLVRDIRGARPCTKPCAPAKPGAPAFAAAQPTILHVAPQGASSTSRCDGSPSPCSASRHGSDPGGDSPASHPEPLAKRGGIPGSHYAEHRSTNRGSFPHTPTTTCPCSWPWLSRSGSHHNQPRLAFFLASSDLCNTCGRRPQDRCEHRATWAKNSRHTHIHTHAAHKSQPTKPQATNTKHTHNTQTNR